jgi:hypothetical protein
VDPYRAPQPEPPPPRDTMRPVLIIAGVIAALIAVVAIAVGVMDKRERVQAEAPVAPRPSPSPTAERTEIAREPPRVAPQPTGIGLDEEVFHPPPPPTPTTKPITRGIIVDGAVHGDTGPKFSSNSFDFTFAIFRADDPTANAVAILSTQDGHGEQVVPPGRYDLCWGSRRESSKARADWRAGCQRVVVAPLVHVAAGVGQAGPSHIFFTCSPAGSCPKS